MSVPGPGLEFVPGLTLLEPLGRGGMGEAWLAHDAVRGRTVVAKVLRAGAPPESAALLRREARLGRPLSHPRVVPALDFRSGEHGSVVTLPHLAGGDARRKRGAPPLAVVRLALDVAEGLEYLHGRGIVHRDVKPSNVLLDEAGRAHITDLGIAASADDVEGPLLRGGGSRGAMSPQQAAGEPARPADDLYALGALLFELLSGRPPLPAGARDGASRPPITSAFPLPESLRSLVRSLLEERPEARPASARAVCEALLAVEAELAGEAASAPAPPALRPPPRPRDVAPTVAPRPRPGRGQVALLAGLLAVAAAAVVWLPRWARSPVAPSARPATPGVSSPAAPAPPATPEASPTVAVAPVAAEVASPVAAEIAPPVAARPRPSSGPPPTPAAASHPPSLLVPAPAPTPDGQAGALARHREAGGALEEREEWAGALREYEAALAIDPYVRFALEGRERAGRRAALAEGLEFHARNAPRLSTEAVAREAEALLERARGVEAPGPRLLAQMAALESALAAARTVFPVVIESDGRTEVTVTRVGRLGTLARRVLELRPGEYTAVGTRPGYRDVRRLFTVAPGASVPAVVVRCEEAL